MAYFLLTVLVMAALVFGASAAGKLRSRAAFRSYRAALAGTGLLPQRLGALWPALSSVLAVGELIVAAGLSAAAVLVVAAPERDTVVRLVLGLALGLAVLLSCVLVAGVRVLIRRGTRARCACFGASAGRPIGVLHLVRNAALLGLVLAAMASDLAGGPMRSGPVAAVVMAAVGGACLALLIIRWEDLAVLVTPVPSIRQSG
jgi:hypothetical protein